MIHDITDVFVQRRAQYFANVLGSREDGDTYLKSATAGTEPGWLRMAREIKAEIDQTEQLVASLEEKHSQKQRSMFNQALANEITMLTDRITRQIRASQSKIVAFKTLEVPKSDREALALQKSLHMSLQANLKKQTTRFRKHQSEYIQQLAEAGDAKNVDLDAVSSGVQQTLQLARDEIQVKEEEIMDITRNIVEIAEMTSQLAEMLHQQGTLLDRIDANMTDALTYADEGVTHLEHARKTQKTIGKLRSAIYAIIGIGYLFMVIYYIMKGVKK